MKHSNLILMTLFAATTLFSQNDFSKEQVFNRMAAPNPYIGLDMLRKDNPYIVIRDITNSTNGTQFNKEKYVTVPYFTYSHYSVVGSYFYDSLQKTWRTSELLNYYIGYDFTSKTVPYAYIHKFYDDSNKNKRIKTSFSFKGKNLPDTQKVYMITETDTSWYLRNIFYHDTLNRIVHISQQHINGSSTESSYTYSSGGKLTMELVLVSKSPFATIDSFSRMVYTYDSLGRISGKQEEMYNMPGRDNLWTVTELISYAYNAKGLLAGDWIYTPDNNFQLVLDHLHLYSYNNQDQVETFIQMRNYKGSFVDRRKLVIFYQGNSAKYGYEYPWDDMDYSHVASRYYVFGTEDIVDLPETMAARKAIQVYPNPAEDIIILGRAIAESFGIYNSLGQLVLTVPAGSGEKIDISVLAPGAYIIMNGQSTPARFIKS